MESFYIIDGNAFAYRAFYGIPPLTTADGLEVHAVYGFFNMLNKVIKDKKPDYLVITFDYPGRTFRHDMYTGYKEKREKMPESLQAQMKMIKEITVKGSIPLLEEEGYEADDLIATLAHTQASKDLHVVIVSGDKDLIQTINKNVSLLKVSRGGDKLLTPESVVEEYGISHENMGDVLSLMGDASDSIPGVKGIGEKTAYNLVKEFGSVENILKNIEKIKPEKVKKLIMSGIDDMKMSRELVNLKVEKEALTRLGFDMKDCAVGKINRAALDADFMKYNFKSLVSGEEVKKDAKPVQKGKHAEHITSFDGLSAGIKKAGTLAIFYAGSDSIEIISLEVLGSYYYMFGKDYRGLPEYFKGKEMITNSSKQVYRDLPDAGARIHDLTLMAYLADPEKTYHDIAGVYMEYEGGTYLSFDDVAGKGAKKIMIELADRETLDKYVFGLCGSAYDLKDKLTARLKTEGMDRLYLEVELPLARVLSIMEKEGLRIDRDYLNVLMKKTEKDIAECEKKIFGHTGHEFNISSPKQLGEVLFEKLGLKGQKKNKSGFSTNVEVLTNLESAHPAVPEILRYRTLTKLKGGFLDVIMSFMDKKDRIHPDYNQNVAATGRLSASNPNIQNIPVRGEEGKNIRKIFIPLKDGDKILKADYSQIELRIMAHFSKDKKLVEAFNNNEDIHSLTGSEIFQTGKAELTHDQRRFAKTINFGIMYGMSPYGLAKQLKIPNQEAVEYIDRFFATFPGVKEYQERTIESCRKNGYVETIIGRRRYFKDINSRNRTIKELSERAAINAPIQGTAADIIKAAMIRIQDDLETGKMESRMILQVHDELVFSAPGGELEKLREIVENKMTGAAKLIVPLTVKLGEGDNWYECG
jgi:DNA polymerase-1